MSWHEQFTKKQIDFVRLKVHLILASYVDQHLQPLLPTMPWYIQDITHLMNKLNEISYLSKDVILVTMDVL